MEKVIQGLEKLREAIYENYYKENAGEDFFSDKIYFESISSEINYQPGVGADREKSLSTQLGQLKGTLERGKDEKGKFYRIIKRADEEVTIGSFEVFKNKLEHFNDSNEDKYLFYRGESQLFSSRLPSIYKGVRFQNVAAKSDVFLMI